MIRIHGLVWAGALMAAWGLTACGSTSRSCPSGDTECSEAKDSSDGGGDGEASSGGDHGGSGGGMSDGMPGPSGAGGSAATGAGGSGSAVTSSTTSGGGSGVGGSGGTATVGSGGSAASGGTGAVPDEQSPGQFDCGEADVPSPLVRLTNTQYDNTVFDLLGVETLDAFDGSRPSEILANDPSDSITELGWESYRWVADAIAEQVMGGPLRSSFITCDPSVAGCLSQTVASFGRSAFRRPLTDDERADYEGLIPDDLMEASDATAQTILASMLASPSFVWRLEQGGLSDPALTSYEVASRLAYFLWNGPPDAELSAAADADELRTEEQLTAQALRMLDDQPRMLRSFAEFHRGYLGLDGYSYWGVTEHDTDMYPYFSSEVNESALAELALFLDDVVVSGGGFQDLFLSNIGYVNQYTALLYGLAPDNFGSELVRVELDTTQRPGLLTRLAFLSSFSGYSETSPILRGSFVTQGILQVVPPAPSPDVEMTPDVELDVFTNRDRITFLTSEPGCVECHSVYINPIGFVLESYDAVGAWQAVDPRGGPIDPVADVFFGDRTETVSNSLELMQKLADSSFAQRHYADEIVAFAFSRPPNAPDACLSDALVELMAQHVSLRELWLEVVRSDEFRTRGALSD